MFKIKITYLSFIILTNKIQKRIQWCAKKNGPCAKKSEPLCKKNEPRNKKLSVKNFIFFVDKLNMIDFNIFKMLKLIFTCESCAISITE